MLIYLAQITEFYGFIGTSALLILIGLTGYALTKWGL